LINRPELLLADEPTAGLGEKAERAILRLIAEVNQAGTPVIVATRDRSLAVRAGSAIYEMPAPNAC
jgi:ABC-type ATPase involved in cell division